MPLSSLNTLLKAESTAQLNAEPYERKDERKGSRNGFRDRGLTTRLGTITLHVPKHRDGVPFKTLIFDNYCLRYTSCKWWTWPDWYE